jgi:antitoxin HicB
MTYTVVLMREDDGRYSVTVPALKGCHTWERNLAHALQMAQEVIEGYLEVLRDQGKAIPGPSNSINATVRG